MKRGRERREGGRDGEGGRNIAGNLLGSRKSAEFDTRKGKMSAPHLFLTLQELIISWCTMVGWMREPRAGSGLSINLSLLSKVNK